MFKANRSKEKKKGGRFKEARHAPPAHRLTRAEKKQIAAILSQTQRTHSVPHTAQETIPYQQMYPDGICRVTDNYYTKALLFQDINYELARDDDKETIIDGWSDILNACDSSLHYQLHYVDVSVMDDERDQPFIRLADPDDGYNSLRREYDTILQPPQSKDHKDQHDMKRAKHLIFGVHADSLRDARPILERTELDLLSHFKRLGVWAEALDGTARLRLLHTIFHMEDPAPFAFDWRWLAPSGLSTKDFIAPSAFDFRDSRSFRMGAGYGAVSCYMILAPELKDRVLTDLLAMDAGMVVSCHVDAIDQVDAIKRVKRKLTDLDAMKINEQKKAIRSGYDMDVLPSDLTTYGNEAKKLLEELQSHNERLFLTALLVMNTAASKRQLESRVKQAQSIAQQHNCALIRLDYQQEAGLVSCLPLGLNQIEIQRSLTTSALAIFIPFTTQELCQTGGEALYYGKNALSRNPIMADRKLLKNANGLFLGVPGSGKSFAAKREFTNAFLTTRDDIIITDPESEYAPLVNRLGGQVIRLSPVSKQYLNPLDINPDYSDEEDPLTLKSDFILSLCELIVANKDGLQPVEKTVIDRCTRLVYQDYLADPRPEKMPVLGDLHALMKQQPEAEAARLATALEIYVTGSLNVFNHRTNVNLTNRLICFDIKELGKALKKIAMLILQDQVWNRVTINRAAHKTTWFYQDEFHLMLKDEQTAAYSVEIWKRFRKWGGIPSGLTQNVKDLLASREIESILENSDFIYMLSQAQGDREILAQRLGISPHQLSYVTQSGEGEGLLFYGHTILPFVDHFPRDTELYRLMSTKPSDQRQAQEGGKAA